MDLHELNDQEGLILIRLLKAMIRADNQLSSQEGAEMKRVAIAMGPQKFVEFIEQARKASSRLADVKAAAMEVQRPAARQLIYSMMIEMAKQDGMDPKEAELLDWLAQTWDLAAQSQV